MGRVECRVGRTGSARPGRGCRPSEVTVERSTGRLVSGMEWRETKFVNQEAKEMSIFRIPMRYPVLSRNDVHVWRASLDLSASQIDLLDQTLSEDEHRRSIRFCFEKDRRRYVAARGLLRILLSRYLGTIAGQIVFEYQKQGKPMVANDLEGKTIQFNLSHIDELAVYSFALNRPVGIDIENLSRSIDFESVAWQFFSPREVSKLLGVAKPLRKRAFFACWTRKEAFVKATGEGLSRPLDQFDVSLAPGEDACLLEIASCKEEALRWKMADLDVGQGYVGALVVKGGGWNLRCWDWLWKRAAIW